MLEAKGVQIPSRLLPMDFVAHQGEIIHIIGPNGSGKSTLLSVLSGLQMHQGEVQFLSQPIVQFPLHELAKLRAYLCQSDRPAFNMSVFQYLSLSIPTDADLDVVEQAVTEISNQLCIAEKWQKNIHHLSGGEWQRVRLAGVCLQVWPSLNPQAKLLLLDEPGAPLDIAQESQLYQMIDLIAKKGLTVIMANHDLNRSLKHADKVLLLKNGVMKGFGKANEILTESTLSEVFETGITCIDHKGQPYLLFE
ncbi:MAG: vitamin B12 ABC transporter ATP-binding protein BtuD [Vibrio sp.]